MLNPVKSGEQKQKFFALIDRRLLIHIHRPSLPASARSSWSVYVILCPINGPFGTIRSSPSSKRLSAYFYLWSSRETTPLTVKVYLTSLSRSTWRKPLSSGGSCAPYTVPTLAMLPSLCIIHLYSALAYFPTLAR